jgi:hypothetical protein
MDLSINQTTSTASLLLGLKNRINGPNGAPTFILPDSDSGSLI